MQTWPAAAVAGPRTGRLGCVMAKSSEMPAAACRRRVRHAGWLVTQLQHASYRDFVVQVVRECEDDREGSMPDTWRSGGDMRLPPYCWLAGYGQWASIGLGIRRQI